MALALRTPGWGFHTVRGGINPGDHRFCPRFVGVADVRKDFWFGDVNLSSPGRAGSVNAGLGIPHRAGRYRFGGPSFSSPVCWSCRCMEGFLIPEWAPIRPGWRWLCEPQVRVPTSCEAVSTRGTSVSSPFRQLCCKA